MDINRRDFLRTASAGAAMWLCGSVKAAGLGDREGPQASPKRPNFVFFLIDDLGWTDLGCYGSTFYETPNIDKLAAQGMRFTDAYAACPVCSPTRASIVAGKYPARLGITQWIGGPNEPTSYRHYLPLEEVTIAEALQEAGYATGFVGKWHLSTREEDRKKYYPDRQGFDINIGGDWSGAPPTYFYPYEKRNRKLESMPPGGEKGEYLTDRLTDESLKFLDANKDKPFLLYLSHYAVHTPVESKQSLTEKYQAKAGNLPTPEGPHAQPVYGRYKTRMVQDHPAYAGMVQSVDESVGRVMDKLAALGLGENTIVIFMSDNGGLSTVPREGPTCNLPLRAGKGVRRRHSRAHADQMAQRGQGRKYLRRTGDEHGLLSDDAGDGGVASATQATPRRRQSRTAAEAERLLAAPGHLLALSALPRQRQPPQRRCAGRRL